MSGWWRRRGVDLQKTESQDAFFSVRGSVKTSDRTVPTAAKVTVQVE